MAENVDTVETARQTADEEAGRTAGRTAGEPAGAAREAPGPAGAPGGDGGDSDRDLADAQRLSSAPVEDDEEPAAGTPVGIGLLGWLRWFWRQLTSMRIALVLLFLLSLAAIPGSLVPQEGENPVRAQEFRAAHRTLAPIYDKIGMFHVFSSVWFSAIYILLFVSLAGCIVPRTWQFARVLRSRPPAAPRNLTRLPVHATWRTDAAPADVLAAAQRTLRRRRFRAHTAGGAVSSEKGYLREAGNLLFHISLFGLLIAVAAGHLWNASGTKLVTVGDGFSNTLTQYDDFTSGALFDDDNLKPFGFTLDSFDATYARSGSQRGAARTFRANITYWNGDENKQKKGAVKVNEPLEVAGYKVYLGSHGYAPVVTVRDGKGNVAFSGAVPCLPRDSNITSTCAVKVPDAEGKDGRPDQLGFSGIFAPTAKIDAVRGPYSSFPAPDYPAIFLTAYHGDLGMDAGIPQNVYQLDRKHLKQFKDAKGDPLNAALRPGETLKLPNGAGSIRIDGVKQWASFQVARQPGNGTALASAALAIAGLVGSLFVRRRRIWVRATEDADGATVVEVAGLARGESGRIADELGDIAVELQAATPGGDAPDRRPKTQAKGTEKE
jgi:cytochrome c biogenesis protein